MSAVLGLHEEHPEAVEREFIQLGLRLRDVGTADFTWHDAYVILHTSMGDQESYVARAVDPKEALWSLTPWMLAEILYGIQVLAWQNAGDPDAPKPQRIERPGVVNDKADESQFGSEPISVEDMADWVGW